jgi:hypothetical protein
MPAAAASAQPPTPTPASLNPGSGASPSAIPATASDLCASVAYKAGFSSTNYPDGQHRAIVLAVAVAMAESSCSPPATNQNGPTSGCPNGSIDRGLWQINDCYHANVSGSCAFNAQCNAIAAYQISNQGTDWTPWATFNNGAYLQFISTAQAAVGRITVVLRNRGAGTCLDADAASRSNGAPIIQWSCNARDTHQQWRVLDVNGDGRLLVLQSVGNGTCLAGDGTASGNGAPLFQWACNATNAFEQWTLRGSNVLSANADATLRNAGDGTCLDADSASAVSGGPIFQWTCGTRDTYQQWS